MKILVLDIETSPNLVWTFGLWNQNISADKIVQPIYIMSWAAKWVGEKTVMYKKYDDPEFLIGIWELMDEADAIVHYNGSAFDIPQLNREFLEAGLPPPSVFKEIDLYKVVKKEFKFPYNSLSYVASVLLNEDKVTTGGIKLWLACLSEEAWAWKKMKEYNIADVNITEKLYLKVRGWIKNHPNHGLYVEDQDNPVCRNCGSQNVIGKGWEQPVTTGVVGYQRYKCKDCGANLRGRTAIKGSKKTSKQVLA